MKTQNTKLQFGKNSIVELNDSQSLGVNGGCQWSESSGQTINLSFTKNTKTTIDGDPIFVAFRQIIQCRSYNNKNTKQKINIQQKKH